MRVRKTSRAAVLVACLVAVGLWWQQRVEAPMRAPRVAAETIDDFMYYYPMFQYAFEEVRAGRVPLWTPYQHCGSPFFATGQHLLLYPLNTLYLVLPTATAMRLTNILHLALALLFTYVLARSFNLARPAAWTAGILFTFSPVLTNLIYAPHHLYGAVWMPLHLALVRRVLTRQRKSISAVMLGAALAAQYLGGYPMHCLFSAYLIGLYVVWFAVSDWRRMSWSTVGALGGAGVLALGLALPQMLPSLELSQLSPRSLGSLTLAMADPYGAPGWRLPLQTLAGTLLPTWRSVFASGFAPHVGAVGAALALIGLVCGQPRRAALFFIFVAVASLLLGLGQSTPLYALYVSLPTGDWFRGPNRIFVLTALALAMVAGHGVDALARGRVGARGVRIALALACTVAVALTVVLFVGGGYLGTLGRYLQNAVALPGEIRFTTRIVWLSGYCGAAIAWLAFYQRLPQVRPLLLGTLPLAAYASLFVSFINYAPLPDTYPDLHTMPPTIVQYLHDHQGHHRTYITAWGGTLVPARALPVQAKDPDAAQPVATKSGLLHHIYAVDDRENVFPARLTQYAARMTPPAQLEQSRAVLAKLGLSTQDMLPQGQFFLRADAPNLRLLDLLGTRFVVEGPLTTFDQHLAPERFPLVFAADGVKIYRNASELPRAFVAARAEIIAQPEAVLDRLTSSDFDPTDTIILEQQPAQSPPADGGELRADVQFERYDPTEVVLDVRTSQPGFLVLTDQYYPGWSADIDGRPAVIERANYLFRAVSIAAGEHRVVFRYAPRSFRLGLLGAAVALVLAALVLMAQRRAAVSDAAPT